MVNPEGVVVINTLQRALRPQLKELISRDTDTRTVVAQWCPLPGERDHRRDAPGHVVDRGRAQQ